MKVLCQWSDACQAIHLFLTLSAYLPGAFNFRPLILPQYDGGRQASWSAVMHVDPAFHVEGSDTVNQCRNELNYRKNGDLNPSHDQVYVTILLRVDAPFLTLLHFFANASILSHVMSCLPWRALVYGGGILILTIHMYHDVFAHFQWWKEYSHVATWGSGPLLCMAWTSPLFGPEFIMIMIIT
jgi:hypothetical protein